MEFFQGNVGTEYEDRNESCNSSNDTSLYQNLNAIQQHDNTSDLNSCLTDTFHVVNTSESEQIKKKFQVKEFVKTEVVTELINCNIPQSQYFEGLNVSIKKEILCDKWLNDVNNEQEIKQKIFKENGRDENLKQKTSSVIKTKKRGRLKKNQQDCRERLRQQAECMREKRKKLYDQESREQRLQRLAKEAAKRREMRMYYETPEQRRKRLDAEAARKREYRMYNESPEEKRKRLDREAERRRIKRLTLYVNETPEQRRDRLNRESAKRREARLNQYAKETEEQKKERLRKDALRAREMRFTRSVIETEEERKQRLVKDALRKRELRVQDDQSINNLTELRNVKHFDGSTNVQRKEESNNQINGHYLSNWMMWFQNTLTQPGHIEQTTELQSSNNE